MRFLLALALVGGLQAQIIIGGGSSGGGSGVSISSGAFSALPGSGTKVGDLFIPTDSVYEMIRWDGSAWEYLIGGREMTLMVSGDYSWVNQGSATVATTAGAVVLTTAGSGTNNLTARVKSAPSAPYTITARVSVMLDDNPSAQAGLLFRESATGKIATCHVYDDWFRPRGHLWTNATTFGSTWTTEPTLNLNGEDLWLQYEYGATNRVCRASQDGLTWYTVGSAARDNGATTAYDQVGIYGANSNSDPVVLTVKSWVEQ